MQNFLGNQWVIGILTSLIAGVILFFVGKWIGLWRKKKKPDSIELANETYQYLTDEATTKTTQLIAQTKKLCDSLIATYKSKSNHDSSLEGSVKSTITDLLEHIDSLVSKLSAADKELDNLKRVVISYRDALKRRNQVAKHLCHPPNPAHMDGGHVRDQLLNDNTKLDSILKAAKGEAVIFLRGYGIGWLERWKSRRKFFRDHLANSKSEASEQYRKWLQVRALHEARK